MDDPFDLLSTLSRVNPSGADYDPPVPEVFSTLNCVSPRHRDYDPLVLAPHRLPPRGKPNFPREGESVRLSRPPPTRPATHPAHREWQRQQCPRLQHAYAV